uniref:ATP-binding cassette sub-family G member 2 n=1 Tax=Lygus hesperus TaxID=30085 RepID=A0A0A9XMA8_LYGHE
MRSQSTSTLITSTINIGIGGSEFVKPGVPQISWKSQLKYLYHRTSLHILRQPMNTILRIAVNISLSLYVGFLFYQTGRSQQSIYARVGFLFFMTSIQAFVTTVGVVLTFAEERALFLREKQKRIYDTSAYFIGRTIVDMGLQTVLAIIFGAFAYPMVGLQGSFKKFLQYTLCLILIGQSTHSYALIVASVIPYQYVILYLYLRLSSSLHLCYQSICTPHTHIYMYMYPHTEL